MYNVINLLILELHLYFQINYRLPFLIIILMSKIIQLSKDMINYIGSGEII